MTPQSSRPFEVAPLDNTKEANLTESDFNDAATDAVTFKESAIQDLSDMISDRDPEILKELVDAFLGDATRQIQGMLRGIHANDMSILFLPAHSLKSSSATFGAMRLAILSQLLEDGLTAPRDHRRLGNLVAQIEAEYAKVAVAMLKALADWCA